MKKVVSLIIIIALLFVNTVVFAAQDPSFDISLEADKIKVNPGDEITVVLAIKNIKNITEGLWAYQAFIQWDSNVLETSETSVENFENWSKPLFNTQSIIDSNISSEVSGIEGVKKDGNVFSIKFKVKENAIIGKNTTITVKNFYASDGENDIEASKEAKVQIEIVEKNNSGNQGTNEENQGTNEENQGTNEENQGTNEENQNQNEENQGQNEGNQGSNEGTKPKEQESNSSSSGSANTSLPQTGENDMMILFVIIGASVLGIMSYAGYKKYNNI